MPRIFVKEDYEAKLKLMRALASEGPAGDKARRQFAQEFGEPILQNVKKQSSIQDIFFEDLIPHGELARYDVDITFSPDATDEYTGAAEDITVNETSILGAEDNQNMLESDFKFVPPKRFSAEAGVDLFLAMNGRFDWVERLKAKLTEAITKKVESSGWSIVQTVAGASSFPSAQKVSIASGTEGYGKFSKQLLVEGLKAMRDVGMIRNYPDALIAAYMSTQSLADFENWDTGTEAVSTSTVAQLSERSKDAIVSVDPHSYDAEFKNVLFKSLTTLGTGDVVSSHDYVYLFVLPEAPLHFVRSVYMTSSGERIQVIDDPAAFYNDDSLRIKVRYAENYAALDTRSLIILDITRS